MPSNHVVKAFLSDLNHAAAPSDIVVWDVGANDGGWSNRLMQLLPERHRNATRLSVFEPQPRFADELTSLAARWSGAFHAVAAATADGGRAWGGGGSRRRSKAAAAGGGQEAEAPCILILIFEAWGFNRFEPNRTFWLLHLY